MLHNIVLVWHLFRRGRCKSDRKTKQDIAPNQMMNSDESTSEASSTEDQNDAVFIHLKNSGHNFDFEDVTILDREDRAVVRTRSEGSDLEDGRTIFEQEFCVSNYRTPGTGPFGIFRAVT